MAHDAAYEGNLPRVQQLVNANNIEEHDWLGRTVLHRACEGGSDEVVDYLVGLKANINARSDCLKTPLYYAVSHSHPKCAKRLLDAGANPTIVNDHHMIPLHRASESIECAALLIAAHPAGVNATNERGWTPLHWAVLDGTTDICNLLVNAGSIVDAVDNDGCTPLYRAFCDAEEDDIAECLIDNGAKLENVKLDSELCDIPEWAVLYAARHEAAKQACRAVLQLAKRKSNVIGKHNGRDVLRLVAKQIWIHRKQ